MTPVSLLNRLGVSSWRNVPRQALIDALRNNNLGCSNLSHQDKDDLVSEALRAWNGMNQLYRDALVDSLKTEIDFRRSVKTG